jgi:TIR domain
VSTGQIFISRAGSDTIASERIARILQAAGYEVILAQRDFPNRNFIERMHEALAGGARVVALLSPDYLKSDYCLAEWTNAIAGDPLNRGRRLIVLRIGACEPQGLLAGIAYTDLVPFRDHPQLFARAVLDAVQWDAAPAGVRDVPPVRAGLRPSVGVIAGAAGALAAILVIVVVLGMRSISGSAAVSTVPPLAAGPPVSEARGGSPPEAPPAAGDPIQAVRTYYAYWNDRRLPEMWSMLSPAFHARTDYTTWAQAHSFDKAIRVAAARSVAPDTVATTIVAIDDAANGGVSESTYHVTWHLISENGRWLLDSYLQF